MARKLHFQKAYVHLALLLTLFLAAACGHAQSFVQPQKITGVYAPYTLAFGDINGDGLTDIIMGSTASYAQFIQVYLAQPGGGFKNSATLPFFKMDGDGVGPVPGCLLADINSDHKLDIVCAGYYQLLATFLGNGDGTFQPEVDKGGNSGYGPVVDGPFDLNGDGIPDFIVDGVPTGVSTYALLGDGHGNFNVSYYFPANSPYLVQTVADINGDGKPDLLASAGPSVASGLGSGKFGSFQSYGTYSSCFYADIDRDGHLDAVCSNDLQSGASTVVVLHGNSDGSFNTAPLLTQSYAGYPVGLLAGVTDINGDGVPDLVFGWNELAAVSVSLGLPNHTGFAAPTTWVNGAPGCFVETPTRFVFPDLNGDGRADLAGCTTNEIDISYGQSNGNLATPPDYQLASSSVAMAIADLNGDAAPDAVSVNDTTGNIDIALAKGDGTFLPTQSYAMTGYTAPAHPYESTGAALIGDFNGDKVPDVLAALGRNDVTGAQVFSNIFWGKGSGTFEPGVVTPASAPTLVVANVLYGSPASYVADVNGDGKDDVVQGAFLPGTYSPLNVFLSNGDGTFREVQNNLPTDSLGPAFGPYGTSNPVFADFNEDGKLDVAYSALTNIYLVPGNGDGSFATGKDLVLPIPPLPKYNGYQYGAYQSVGAIAGDFDGDGHQDLATVVLGQCACFPTGTDAVFLIVYFGDGHGGLSSGLIADQVLYQAGTVNYMLPMAAADFRREGRPEIVFSAGSAGTPPVGEVNVVHITTQRTVDMQSIVTGDQTIFTGDFNGDGFPDLLLTIPGYTQVKVLLNLTGAQGTLTSTATALTQTATTITTGGSITFTATVSPSSATGTVTFLDGSVKLGSGTLAAGTATYSTTALSTGIHSITASYGGAANDYVSTSVASIITVNAPPAIGTTTTLESTATTVVTGTSITFTATVTPASGSIAPSGAITFLDGTATLGTSTLSTGKATFSTSMLAVGPHSITASYSGVSGAFSASASSPAISVVVTAAPDFTLALSPTTATVTHGTAATTGISITPINGFSALISLTCTGAPANSNCIIAPASLKPSGTAANSATLTLQTNVQIGMFAPPATYASRLAPIALAAAFPFGMLALLAARRRDLVHPRFLSAVFLFACLVSIAACGSGSATSTVQAAYPREGTYPITVTAASGSNIHAATFIVTIE